jgi:heme/copper-type cytochrome/quinol oxidase subunit 2
LGEGGREGVVGRKQRRGQNPNLLLAVVFFVLVVVVFFVFVVAAVLVLVARRRNVGEDADHRNVVVLAVF